jgi:hypothetical protein
MDGREIVSLLCRGLIYGQVLHARAGLRQDFPLS